MCEGLRSSRDTGASTQFVRENLNRQYRKGESTVSRRKDRLFVKHLEQQQESGGSTTSIAKLSCTVENLHSDLVNTIDCWEKPREMCEDIDFLCKIDRQVFGFDTKASDSPAGTAGLVNTLILIQVVMVAVWNECNSDDQIDQLYALQQKIKTVCLEAYWYLKHNKKSLNFAMAHPSARVRYDEQGNPYGIKNYTKTTSNGQDTVAARHTLKVLAKNFEDMNKQTVSTFQETYDDHLTRMREAERAKAARIEAEKEKAAREAEKARVEAAKAIAAKAIQAGEKQGLKKGFVALRENVAAEKARVAEAEKVAQEAEARVEERVAIATQPQTATRIQGVGEKLPEAIAIQSNFREHKEKAAKAETELMRKEDLSAAKKAPKKSYDNLATQTHPLLEDMNKRPLSPYSVSAINGLTNCDETRDERKPNRVIPPLISKSTGDAPSVPLGEERDDVDIAEERAKAAEEAKAANTIERIFRRHLDKKAAKAAKEEAATLIQSKVRQGQAKAKLEAANTEAAEEAKAANTIERIFRGHLGKKAARAEKEKAEAATRIQSKVRQGQAKAKLEAANTEAAEEAKAANTIERIFRGHLGKKAARAEKEKAEAATRIQSKVRQGQAKAKLEAAKLEAAAKAAMVALPTSQIKEPVSILSTTPENVQGKKIDTITLTNEYQALYKINPDAALALLSAAEKGPKSLRTLYRKLLMQYHPDKNNSRNNQMSDITNLYQALLGMLLEDPSTNGQHGGLLENMNKHSLSPDSVSVISIDDDPSVALGEALDSLGLAKKILKIIEKDISPFISISTDDAPSVALGEARDDVDTEEEKAKAEKILEIIENYETDMKKIRDDFEVESVVQDMLETGSNNGMNGCH